MTQAPTIPEFRRDLEILPGEDVEDDHGAWLIFDPLQYRYFQIDGDTRKLLTAWRGGVSIAEMTAVASEALGKEVGSGDIEKVIRFLRKCDLTEESNEKSSEKSGGLNGQEGQPAILVFFQRLLFFKMPLLRPNKFLTSALPHVEFLFQRSTLVFISIFGVLGLYFVSRQWEAFIGSIRDAFTLEGAIIVAASIIVLKVLHELGHAFTTVRHGCHVRSMGVAFMFMMPLLYTDITDTWRLTSRKQRIAVSAAGIAVELGVACLATFIWIFLPDGAPRTAIAIIATTAWITSLFVNLNPCMKFDGYYILSDLLKVDNLQSRAFALGRWRLKKLLFAPDLTHGDRFSSKKEKFLIAYAWITWVYRLVLFTVISALAYHFVFKPLGLIIVAMIIFMLLARPIFRELISWRKTERQYVSVTRAGGFLAAASVLLVLLAVPWSTRINIPTVIVAADLAQVYPGEAGEIVAVSIDRGQRVEAGQILFQLERPEITNKIERVRIQRERARYRLSRAIIDQEDRTASLVLEQEIASLDEEMAGLRKQADELTVRAPIDGVVLQIGSDLHRGRWIGKSDRLAVIASRENYVVQGYVSETELHRFAEGAEGRFVPADVTHPAYPVRLERVAKAGSQSIELPELASLVGGKIRVEQDDADRFTPVSAQYFVELTPLQMARAPDRVVHGVVQLEGKAESYLLRMGRQITKVAVRESGI